MIDLCAHGQSRTRLCPECFGVATYRAGVRDAAGFIFAAAREHGVNLGEVGRMLESEHLAISVTAWSRKGAL